MPIHDRTRIKVSGLDSVAVREKPGAADGAVTGCVDDDTLCWDGGHGAGGKQWVQSSLRVRFFFNNEQCRLLDDDIRGRSGRCSPME